MVRGRLFEENQRHLRVGYLYLLLCVVSALVLYDDNTLAVNGVSYTSKYMTSLRVSNDGSGVSDERVSDSGSTNSEKGTFTVHTHATTSVLFLATDRILTKAEGP